MSDQIDSSTVHPARRYNYWLGGKDNFAVDRASGDEILKKFPTARIAALENRRFLQRATRHLAGAGIRQFLDIGTGLPTADNTHEVAQTIAPDSRIVYVDNDPMVMAHARALLAGTPAGRTTYLEADLRDPAAILTDPMLRETLDLGRPVALMLVAVLHFIPGAGSAQPIVEELMDALPGGSYLVATNATKDPLPEPMAAAYDAALASGLTNIWPRDAAEFGALFAGLELIEPGITIVSDWRPEDDPAVRANPAHVAMYGAVARKP